MTTLNAHKQNAFGALMMVNCDPDLLPSRNQEEDENQASSYSFELSFKKCFDSLSERQFFLGLLCV